MLLMNFHSEIDLESNLGELYCREKKLFSVEFFCYESNRIQQVNQWRESSLSCMDNEIIRSAAVE